MNPSAIASAYDLLAERWLDDRFSQSDGVRQHKLALSFLEGNSRGLALNVGCGCNTRLNGLLRDSGLEVEGVDVSEKMVALARKADPGLQIHLADVCAWQPSRSYEFISAWDSIWHVRLSKQHALMVKLLNMLIPGGVLIFTAGGLDAPSEHVDSNMGPTVYYSTLGIPALLQVIGECRCVVRHLEFDQRPQSHLFVVAQRSAQPLGRADSQRYDA